jgi:hypothetical protein
MKSLFCFSNIGLQSPRQIDVKDVSNRQQYGAYNVVTMAAVLQNTVVCLLEFADFRYIVSDCSTGSSESG